MPRLIAQQRVWIGGYDISASIKSLAEATDSVALDNTCLGHTTRQMQPGLKGWGLVGDGLWNGQGIDAQLASYQGTTDVPVTIAYEDGTAGTFGKSALAMIYQLKHGPAAVGELLPTHFELGAMGPPSRGKVLYFATATTDVTSAFLAMDAVTATEALFARLHVFGGSTAMSVLVQSDSTATGPSPVTVATFTTLASTVTSTHGSVVATASNADTFYRITATAAAGRSFAVFVGIANRI